MQSSLTQSVARAQAEDRLRRARERARAAETAHPPSRVRLRAATAAARLARRLDAESARRTLSTR